MPNNLGVIAYMTLVLLRITPRARLIVTITSIPFVIASIRGVFQGVIWDIINAVLGPSQVLTPFIENVIYFMKSLTTFLAFASTLATAVYTSITLPQYLDLNKGLYKSFSLFLMSRKASSYMAVLHAFIIVLYSYALGISMGIVLSLIALKALSSLGLLGIDVFEPNPLVIIKEALPIYAVLTTVYTAESALWSYRHAPIP